MVRQNSSTKKSRKRPGAASDAIALLKADHKAVKAMFEAYEELMDNEAEDSEKQELALRICNELTVHAQIEEEVFYPALRDVFEEQDLLDEAEVEHASAKDLIAQLEGMAPDEDLYDAKVKVLGEYINHHVEEEEGEMFPKATKAKVDTKALGEQLAARQQELKADLGLLDADEEMDESEVDEEEKV